MDDFGHRLRTAFGSAKRTEIAKILNVSEAAVKNYLAGRVPDSEKLLLIAKATNCNLHWLLTGEGDRNARVPEHPKQQPVKEDPVIQRLREIVREELSLLRPEIIGAGAQYLGNVDEFDIEESLRRTGNHNIVLMEWYAHEGITDLEPTFGVNPHGFENLDFDDKIEAIRQFKTVLDKHLK
jgi:transcriptional regulator with XRE-family HTH domain